MNQQKKDAILAILADGADKVTAAEIAEFAHVEQKKAREAADVAAAPKRNMPDAEWALYKAYLLDGDADPNWMETYGEALAALRQDKKQQFFLAQDRLFKRARKALPQFEIS